MMRTDKLCSSSSSSRKIHSSMMSVVASFLNATTCWRSISLFELSAFKRTVYLLPADKWITRKRLADDKHTFDANFTEVASEGVAQTDGHAKVATVTKRRPGSFFSYTQAATSVRPSANVATCRLQRPNLASFD